MASAIRNIVGSIPTLPPNDRVQQRQDHFMKKKLQKADEVSKK